MTLSFRADKPIRRTTIDYKERNHKFVADYFGSIRNQDIYKKNLQAL